MSRNRVISTLTCAAVAGVLVVCFDCWLDDWRWWVMILLVSFIGAFRKSDG